MRTTAPSAVVVVWLTLAGVAAQNCALQPAYPNAWWRMEGDATDQTVKNPGTVTGTGSSYTAAKVGSGWRPGSGSALFQVPSNASLNPPEFTIEGWLLLNAIGFYNSTVAWKGDSTAYNSTTPYAVTVCGTSPSQCALLGGSASQLGFVVGNGVTSQFVHSTQAVPIGQFFHFAAIGSAARLQLYLNGQLATDVVRTVSSWTNTQPLSIGAVPGWGGAFNFNGVIDEITLYPQALNASQILSIYSAGAAGKCISARSLPPRMVFRDSSGWISMKIHGSVGTSSAPGNFAGDPAVGVSPNGDTFVAARDHSQGIWLNVWRQGTQLWDGWKLTGATTADDPAIAVTPSGVALLAVRDLWSGYWLNPVAADGTLGAWQFLGGILGSPPVLAAASDGTVYIVGQDNWGGLWSGRWLPFLGWQGWHPGGGVTNGKPAATVGSDNVLYVAAADSWRALWLARVQADTWLGWSFGGAVIGVGNGTRPRIASTANFTVTTALLDSWGGLWLRPYLLGTPGGWLPVSYIGGVLNDIDVATRDGQIFVGGRTAQQDLYWYRGDNGTWQWLGPRGLVAGGVALGSN